MQNTLMKYYSKILKFRQAFIPSKISHAQPYSLAINQKKNPDPFTPITLIV